MVKQIFGARTLVVSAACTLAACTSLRVTSDVNQPLAGTVQCHTFAWAGSFRGGSDTLRSNVANPVNESRLRAAIQANLGSAGVQPVTANADCLVGYGIGVQNVLDYPEDGWGWGGGFGYQRGFAGGWGGAWGGYGYPYAYREGIVAVDLYDAKTRQALWHASANQNLAGVTGDKADAKIKAAVSAIFTKFPHGA